MKNPATNGDGIMSDSSYAALLQGITDSTPDASARTAQAALQQPQPTYPEPNVFDQAGVQGTFDDPTAHLHQNVPPHQINPTGQSIFDARAGQQNKPAVGSQEWHQLRKDNHKEVERRRREVINEGIENLAKLIPSPDKNKGAILTGAIRYIQELQAKIEAFDNERRIFDLTQQELTKRNEALRDSAQRSWQETAKWMGRCKDHGLQYDDYDITIGATEALEESTANLTGDGAGYTAGGVDKAENSVP